MIEKIALAFDKKEKKKMISPLPLQGASGNRVCPWPRDLKTKVHHRSTPRRRLFMFWRLAARRRSLPSSDSRLAGRAIVVRRQQLQQAFGKSTHALLLMYPLA
jgi:hypothetical protein